jgi:hypothetical protein
VTSTSTIKRSTEFFFELVTKSFGKNVTFKKIPFFNMKNERNMGLHVSPNIWCDIIKLSVLIALKDDTSLSY